jgi:hypothetical protein
LPEGFRGRKAVETALGELQVVVEHGVLVTTAEAVA